MPSIYTTVMQLRRSGQPIRAHSRPVYLGEVQFCSEPCKVTKRTRHVLRLLRVGMGGRTEDVIPPLLDAEMVTYGPTRGTMFRGLEDLGGGREVAQSWLVEVHAEMPSVGSYR